MVKIIEIDGNNNSNVFKNSTTINAVSVTLKNGEEAFADAIYDQMQNNTKIIIDFGGGDDSRRGINIIQNFDVSFTYIIPLNNSLAQIKNALDTYNLIRDKSKVIFALNQINNFKDIKKEWCFWFGNKELGLESAYDKLLNPTTIYIPKTPLFEISALSGYTITELANFARGIENATKLFFNQAKGDKEIFLKLASKHSRAQAAIKYVDSILIMLKEVLQDANNVAVISTKGGVGKSTIAWHLLPAAMEG
jgi:hypothetical protein